MSDKVMVVISPASTKDLTAAQFAIKSALEEVKVKAVNSPTKEGAEAIIVVNWVAVKAVPEMVMVE